MKFVIHWLLGLVQIANLVLQRLWHNMHFILNMYYLVVGIACVLESYLISSGLWKEYKAFNSGKVKYLAIVVESEEAYLTSRIVKLLSWLEALGVKHICLFDAEGENFKLFKHRHSTIGM